MVEKRGLAVLADRMDLSRRLRVLRHRAARWFLPPVRQADRQEPPSEAGDEPARDEPRGGEASRN